MGHVASAISRHGARREGRASTAGSRGCRPSHGRALAVGNGPVVACGRRAGRDSATRSVPLAGFGTVRPRRGSSASSADGQRSAPWAGGIGRRPAGLGLAGPRGKVTVAASDRASDRRAPARAARAGPDGAARKAVGDSPRRVIAGATLSSVPLVVLDAPAVVAVEGGEGSGRV